MVSETNRADLFGCSQCLLYISEVSIIFARFTDSAIAPPCILYSIYYLDIIYYGLIIIDWAQYVSVNSSCVVLKTDTLAENRSIGQFFSSDHSSDWKGLDPSKFSLVSSPIATYIGVCS